MNSFLKYFSINNDLLSYFYKNNTDYTFNLHYLMSRRVIAPGSAQPEKIHLLKGEATDRVTDIEK